MLISLCSWIYLWWHLLFFVMYWHSNGHTYRYFVHVNGLQLLSSLFYTTFQSRSRDCFQVVYLRCCWTLFIWHEERSSIPEFWFYMAKVSVNKTYFLLSRGKLSMNGGCDPNVLLNIHITFLFFGTPYLWYQYIGIYWFIYILIKQTLVEKFTGCYLAT